MNQNYLDLLVCPQCKGRLVYYPEQNGLICRFDKLLYPIVDDVAVMVVDEAEKISS
ncbi:MAG: Trm112 family protein [Gammaproteobacteria bacterium]